MSSDTGDRQALDAAQHGAEYDDLAVHTTAAAVPADEPPPPTPPIPHHHIDAAGHHGVGDPADRLASVSLDDPPRLASVTTVAPPPAAIAAPPPAPNYPHALISEEGSDGGTPPRAHLAAPLTAGPATRVADGALSNAMSLLDDILSSPSHAGPMKVRWR